MAKSNDTCGAFDIDALKNLNSDTMQKMSMHNRGTDEPIFIVDDLRTTQQPLALLLRLLLVRLNMGQQEFTFRFRETAESDNISIAKCNSDRANRLHNIRNKRISCNMLEGVLYYLGLSIADMSMTVVDRKTGQVISVSLKDVQDILNERNNQSSDKE